MKKYISIITLFVMVCIIVLPAYTVLAENEPGTIPTGTDLFTVTLIALVDPNFEMQADNIVVEFQNQQHRVDEYEFILEKINHWTKIIELPAGDYILLDVGMNPRSLHSEFPVGDCTFTVGHAQNMTVTFTIGDPNAVVSVTPTPAVWDANNTPVPTPDPNVTPTPAIAEMTKAPSLGTDNPDTTPDVSDSSANPITTNAPSDDNNSPSSATLILLLVLLIVGITLFGFIIFKNIKH